MIHDNLKQRSFTKKIFSFVKVETHQYYLESLLKLWNLKLKAASVIFDNILASLEV